MNKIVIHGPKHLHGNVRIQGAKNAAMKYMLLPLLTKDVFRFENIPNIGSTKNLGDITALQGAKIVWEPNKVEIDTRSVLKPRLIPAELFYYTSGAIFTIPILASRFGRMEIELSQSRDDTGGDAIGSRNMTAVIETLERCGIGYNEEGNKAVFEMKSDLPFDFQIQNKSFGASVNTLLAALFKKGVSIIRGQTETAEFSDIVEFLKTCGASIKVFNDRLEVEGKQILKGVRWKNISDKNDFVTWAAMAIATKSEISFSNLSQIDRLGIDAFLELVKFWGIEFKFDKTDAKIDLSKMKLKPVSILAGNPPMFHTDWQPLIAPLLTQIDGESSIIDTIFDNRMQYWKQLEKMGAKFKFFEDPKYPQNESRPRAVRIFGQTMLHCSNVEALDVRSGAALAIAGLIGNGKTEISGVEHIERGYENFEARLKSLELKVTGA